MKVTDYITEDHVLFLPADLDKCGVIRYIIQNAPYFQSDKWNKEIQDSLIRSILKREELGSSGFGRGGAVPHTKHFNVHELAAFFACSREGVDFHSLDGEPTYFFWLCISPFDQPGLHLRFLEAVSRSLKRFDDSKKAEILNATKKNDVVMILASLESN